MERQVHVRDVCEVLAAVILVRAIAAAWPLYRSSLVAILGVALIFAGAALVIYVLMSAKATAPLPFHASVLECSRNRLVWLDRQIRMLRTVAWWYLGPLFGGSLLLHWGLTGGGIAFGVVVLVLLAVGTGIVLLNQAAARRHLQPVREEVLRLIEALESADAK